jgi:hypothetical protein
MRISAMITNDEYAAARATPKKIRSDFANGLLASLRLSTGVESAFTLMESIIEG